MDQENSIILLKVEEYEDLKKQLHDKDREIEFYKKQTTVYKEQIDSMIEKDIRYIRDVCSCLD